MIDIGSGGGSPAIPFALALAGVRLLMVESKTRKSVFLRRRCGRSKCPLAKSPRRDSKSCWPGRICTKRMTC